MKETALTVAFAPALPDAWLYALCGAALLLFFLSFRFYKRGLVTRVLCAAAFILFLFNPSLVEEQREAVPDVAVIIADRSPSQEFGARGARTDAALAALKEKLDGLAGLELRVVESAGPAEGPATETRLFDRLEQAMADVPAARRAGVILLTDGQVHDAPQDKARFGDYGPVHVLLSGEREERDRQLVILEAPSYGIVGQTVTVRYRITDSGAENPAFASLIVRQDNMPPRTEVVPVNHDQTLDVSVEHAGQNILDMEVAPAENELTPANNRVPLIINGVRDRLRVLLVSGQPHAGGRTWRNLLTSDPGVDLVHFTILREPEKLDATPQNELALIAFPFQELFEIKLYDFDLIIFDRYSLNRILPDYYFGNIARYVREGGALLEASGPSFTTGESIYATALKEVLPAAPTGQLIERAYKAALSPAGRRHPVTQGLRGAEGVDGKPSWGPWLRQVGIAPARGDVLMTGADGLPLLVLDRVGKGRVAQLATDQIWLWSRGFQGGGPEAELLRRLGHWLMKEPELEENALSVTIEGGTLLVRRRSLTGDPVTVTVTDPEGATRRAALEPVRGGDGLETRLPADRLGVYKVSDGAQERFALAGAVNPKELSGVLTTDKILGPVAAASGGGVHWLAEESPAPDIRRAAADRKSYSGRGWIGLKQKNSYNVTGVRYRPLLPEWACALALLGLAAGGWWWEGRNRKGTKSRENRQAGK